MVAFGRIKSGSIKIPWELKSYLLRSVWLLFFLKHKYWSIILKILKTKFLSRMHFMQNLSSGFR